jgi:predicted permease
MTDLRLAVRAYRSTPVVTTVLILSLGLGIGANSAIFSIVDSLVLRGLPVARPDRLALLEARVPGGIGATPWSNPVWEQFRQRTQDTFQAAFAFAARTARVNLSSGGEAIFADGLLVSGEYFGALGVPPLLGRTITPDDDRRGGGATGPVAVISYGFWQRRFAGARDVIGRSQTIERVPFTIVGVMPRSFFGVDVGSAFDVAVPLGTEPLMRGRDSYLDRPTTSWLNVMVRLKDGQSLESARHVLPALHQQIRNATMPPGAAVDLQMRYLVPAWDLQSAPNGPSALRVRYREPLLAVFIVVALVLLIACSNVANLLLARATARRHEFSVLMAVGASRWRLARQVILESILLSAMGALLGLAIAYWGGPFLVRQLSTHTNTVFLDVRLDWRVAGFTALVTSLAALFFGVWPALRASRAEPIDALRQHGQVGDRRTGLAAGWVTLQVALTLVLVVAASLFLRTFQGLVTRDLGFDRESVLLAQLDVRNAGVSPEQRVSVYERFIEAVRSTPGVARAAVSAITPVSGSLIDVVVQAEGAPPPTLPQNVSYRNVITPDWFSTYGTRIIAGRDFQNTDRPASPLVVIVNETFVRKFLPGGRPLAQRIRQGLPGRQSPWMEVVGICADATYRSVRESVSPTLYVPLSQQTEPPALMTLSLRPASGPPALLARSAAESLARVNGNVVMTFTPLKQQVDAALVQERILALLSVFFGSLALLLAALGLYGLTWYTVSRRRNEIGIRAALGATPGRLMRLVFSYVTILLTTGIVIGLGASWWTMRLLASLLYDVEPRDVGTLAWSVVIMASVGAAAAWIPARHASRIDPAALLRTS